MPTIHITLTDTPTGGVSIAHDFKPSVGAPCSPAQSVALELLARTRKQYGIAAEDGGITLASAHPCHQTQTGAA